MSVDYETSVYKVDRNFRTTTIYRAVNGKVRSVYKRTADAGLSRAERVEIHEKFLKSNGFSIKVGCNV